MAEDKKQSDPAGVSSATIVTPQDVARKRSRKFFTNVVVIIIIMTIIGMGLTMISMTGAFMFLAGAMLPGIVAYLIDWRPGRFASKTVIAFNLAGLIPQASAIFSSGSPNSVAMTLFKDPMAWLIIYGFAAFGWGAVFIIPHITKLYLEIKADYTIKKLSHFQEKLLEEWGDEIKKPR